jgi:sulfate adenylyltransferase large subunit
MTASIDDIELLRISTAGSVDDGKSTLIGRLLHDSKSIFEDQLEALQRSADISGGGEINLANLTDGLRDERLQGITIDVAYRYFATPRRKFIIADTPGHVQYTRNMVTGASTANLALILIDARNGVSEQTRRHAFISSLLKIPHMVVCINKMDLVDYDENRFKEIRDEFSEFAAQLDVRDINFMPISALQGDNVVEQSTNMPWHQGPSLLRFLEDVYIASDMNLKEFRLPVQWVIRPNSDEHHDFRGFSGQVAGGTIKVGDPVVVLPSGKESKVKAIHTYDGEVEEAFCPMSVSLLLEDNIDISRGDMIVNPDSLPHVGKEIDANVCWMDETPLQIGRKYVIKQGSNSTRMVIKEVIYKVNVDSLENDHTVTTLGLNDIGRINFKTANPLMFDNYRKNRGTGGFIIIDEASNLTLAAGMIRSPHVEEPAEFEGYMI